MAITYNDEWGIFYLLPYDIGANSGDLARILPNTISSDELSLWMQDITASEMIMIIDACHSSAAVQGDGFKPGPMGSRGLGQLAFDKDMKILSATQADNIALESNKLEQGLLSYALLQEGVIELLADTNEDRQLSSVEWLSFAERRVPELYKEVICGRRAVLINGRKNTADVKSLQQLDRCQRGSGLIQQPTLFDFKRRSAPRPLFSLP